MKKNGSTSEKEEWRRLEGKNPTKWHWEKGSWRWGLDKIEALQNGSGIFICFIKSWMHWFDHFLTKLSKYLWIKTGDRHYHFVEPWVIDRPFCRMETVYQNHFVETGVGSLQNGAPQPPPGNGKEDYIYILGHWGLWTNFWGAPHCEKYRRRRSSWWNGASEARMTERFCGKLAGDRELLKWFSSLQPAP